MERGRTGSENFPPVKWISDGRTPVLRGRSSRETREVLPVTPFVEDRPGGVGRSGSLGTTCMPVSHRITPDRGPLGLRRWTCRDLGVTRDDCHRTPKDLPLSTVRLPHRVVPILDVTFRSGSERGVTGVREGT